MLFQSAPEGGMPEASLSWLALTLTPVIAVRLSVKLLREFGSPEQVFRACLTGLESCGVPAPVAQAIFKKQTFWRAEKEVAAIRRIGIWTRSLWRARQRDPGSELCAKFKQGAKLVTNAEDVIEELPTPVRTVLVQAEVLESQQRNLLAADGLNNTERKIYELLRAEEPRHIDDLVETSGLNSSEVLATLFDLEMKGIIRQLPGT
jgi:predicted Rossmann fold nucleotide-binding protein DprA/Smf involved in DNA uptake